MTIYFMLISGVVAYFITSAVLRRKRRRDEAAAFSAHLRAEGEYGLALHRKALQTWADGPGYTYDQETGRLERTIGRDGKRVKVESDAEWESLIAFNKRQMEQHQHTYDRWHRSAYPSLHKGRN